MPEIYFNPYPGRAEDAQSGQQALITAARAVLAIKEYLDQFYNPAGDIPIREFVLYKDPHSGAQQTIPSTIYSLAGRERELVKRFLMLFDRGQALTTEDLGVCRDWVLCGLGAPAPVLEYAARRDGMAATLPTEIEWKRDFLQFEGREERLPNIYGQSELNPLYDWIEKWYERCSDFTTRLEKVCGLAICREAMCRYVPSPSEHDLTINMIQRAAQRHFEHDGYLVKDVSALTNGVIKQIKQKGSGVRVYVGVSSDRDPCLAGFFKKGQGDERAQNKAISLAGINAGVWWREGK